MKYLLMIYGNKEHMASFYLLDCESEERALLAVRAHLRELAGDTEAAAADYVAAAGRTTSAPERRYLALQASRLNS